MDRRDWDERYRDDELFWGVEPNRFLAEEVRDLRPGRALDLAAGEGRNAVWLAERGWEVLAVDFSVVALAKGRRLAEGHGARVEWLAADLTQWRPPGRAFDLVVALYLQLEADARRQVLAHAADAVAPGGTLLVVAHDRRNLAEGVGGPRDPAVLYDPDEVAADLSDLRVERAERVRRPVVQEGGITRHALDTLVRARREAPAGEAALSGAARRPGRRSGG